MEALDIEALKEKAEPVKVRPLEWAGEGNGEFIALSVVGWYHISMPASCWNVLTPPANILAGYQTLDEAKAAAQADYEQRILSALDLAELSSLRSENEGMRKALDGAFCVLFLDGRNEHGSHVIPAYPCSIDLDAEDVAEQAELILTEAENLGFVVGMDHVWAEFTYIEQQVGEFGRVELEGYWDFSGINVEMTKAILSSLKEEDAR